MAISPNLKDRELDAFDEDEIGRAVKRVRDLEAGREAAVNTNLKSLELLGIPTTQYVIADEDEFVSTSAGELITWE